MILELHPIENVLASRKPFDQGINRKVGLRQGVHVCDAMAVLEAVRGRPVDQGPGPPVGTRPYYRGIDRHIARLHAVADRRPIGSAAYRRLGNTAGGGNPCQSRRLQQSTARDGLVDANGHEILPSSREISRWQPTSSS